MKFTVTSSELINAINKVIGVIPTRSTLPILGNIYMDLSGNELTLIGSDLEVYVKAVINVDGKTDGSVAVPAKKIETLIQSLQGIELSIELQQNYKLSIKTKGGKWHITGEDPNDFPLPAEIENAKTIDLDNKLLSRYLAKAIHAASQDELRRSMNGVYFEISKGELKVVSTDGHRLVRIIRTNFKYDGEKTSMLVPIKTCQLMIKLFRSTVKAAEAKGQDEAEGDESNEPDSASKDVTIYFSNEFIQCTYNNTTITSRLIDDTFPNYESVIPTENEKLLKVKKSPLLGSIKRSIIMSDQVTNKTSMLINESELKVKASNNEFGTDSEEVIECNFTDNEEFEIAFNGKYLLDAVQQFECDEILFNFSTPLKASILRPTEPNEDEDMIMLVMPVRNI
jgi:DNA polymerase-3 subunit beta